MGGEDDAIVIHGLRAALQHVYGMADLRSDMPRAAAGFGVFAGGLTVTVLVYHALAYACLGRRWRAEYVRVLGKQMKRFYPSWTRSVRFLFVFVFVGLLLGASIWFGSAWVGFNPWTTAAATIAISIIGTYGFSEVLRAASTAMTVHAENAIQVGEYWEFQAGGPEWGGIIATINMFNVELMRYNKEEDSTEIIVYPIDYFFKLPRKHRPALELAGEEPFVEASVKEGPAQPVLPVGVRAYKKDF